MNNGPRKDQIVLSTNCVQVDKGDDALAGALAISPVSVAMLSNGDFYSYSSGTSFSLRNTFNFYPSL